MGEITCNCSLWWKPQDETTSEMRGEMIEAKVKRVIRDSAIIQKGELTRTNCCDIWEFAALWAHCGNRCCNWWVVVQLCSSTVAEGVWVLTDRLRIRLMTDRCCCGFLIISVVGCSKMSLWSIVIARYLNEETISMASLLMRKLIVITLCW